MSRAPTLFDGMAVDYGRSLPSLADGRRLVAAVEVVLWETDDFADIDESASRLIPLAARVGAHSIARALRWFSRPDAIYRHGFEQQAMRVEDVARRWLARQEAARVPRRYGPSLSQGVGR